MDVACDFFINFSFRQGFLQRLFPEFLLAFSTSFSVISTLFLLGIPSEIYHGISPGTFPGFFQRSLPGFFQGFLQRIFKRDFLGIPSGTFPALFLLFLLIRTCVFLQRILPRVFIDSLRVSCMDFAQDSYRDFISKLSSRDFEVSRSLQDFPQHLMSSVGILQDTKVDSYSKV